MNRSQFSGAFVSKGDETFTNFTTKNSTNTSQESIKNL